MSEKPHKQLGCTAIVRCGVDLGKCMDTIASVLLPEHYTAIKDSVRELTALLSQGQSETDRGKILSMLSRLVDTLMIVKTTG